MANSADPDLSGSALFAKVYVLDERINLIIQCFFNDLTCGQKAKVFAKLHVQ